MSGKTETEDLASYWQQQIEAWQSSGQTQQAYCKVVSGTGCVSFGDRRSRCKARKVLVLCQSPIQHPPSPSDYPWHYPAVWCFVALPETTCPLSTNC